MLRTARFAVALILATGLVSASAQPASAQYWGSYYGPTYSSNYAPGYSSTSYYSSWGALDPVNWFGGYSSYSPAYTSYYSPSYSSPSYSSYYSPSYTAGYSPSYTAGYGVSGASYYGPPLASAGCCSPCNSCCNSCSSGCSSCSGGVCSGQNCPGGNCSAGYTPDDGRPLRPQPEPATGGASGSRTIESEGSAPVEGFRRSTTPPDDGVNPNAGPAPGSVDPYNPRTDGFGPSPMGGTSRETRRPPTTIQQRAPAEATQPMGNEADPAEEKTEEEEPAADLDELFKAPLIAPEVSPEAERLRLNLDTRITSTGSLLRTRRPMAARFGSPVIARAQALPADGSGQASIRLVQK